MDRREYAITNELLYVWHLQEITIRNLQWGFVYPDDINMLIDSLHRFSRLAVLSGFSNLLGHPLKGE
jgi:hypothetical protein